MRRKHLTDLLFWAWENYKKAKTWPKRKRLLKEIYELEKDIKKFDELARAARKYLKQYGVLVTNYNCFPIEILGDKNSPRLIGEEGYYKNRRGEIIEFPLTYAKKGWSSMVYHKSTQVIIVGWNWKEEEND